jgi:hypothetical protein
MKHRRNLSNSSNLNASQAYMLPLFAPQWPLPSRCCYTYVTSAPTGEVWTDASSPQVF